MQDDSSQKQQKPDDRLMRGNDAFLQQLIDVCLINKRYLTGPRLEHAMNGITTIVRKRRRSKNDQNCKGFPFDPGW